MLAHIAYAPASPSVIPKPSAAQGKKKVTPGRRRGRDKRVRPSSPGSSQQCKRSKVEGINVDRPPGSSGQITPPPTIALPDRMGEREPETANIYSDNLNPVTASIQPSRLPTDNSEPLASRSLLCSAASSSASTGTRPASDPPANESSQYADLCAAAAPPSQCTSTPGGASLLALSSVLPSELSLAGDLDAQATRAVEPVQGLRPVEVQAEDAPLRSAAEATLPVINGVQASTGPSDRSDIVGHENSVIPPASPARPAPRATTHASECPVVSGSGQAAVSPAQIASAGEEAGGECSACPGVLSRLMWWAR